MSKIALSGNASGTGTFTIASPNSNSDRTLTLPDSAGTLATAESTLTQFNASGSAPVYAARAWVNFNGTGTPAIRASGNVSSITDNGTGNYTLNFAVALPDTNYCPVFGNEGGFDVQRYQSDGSKSTGTYQVLTGYQATNGALVQADIGTVLVAIFR
jgi:hypothetical protein